MSTERKFHRGWIMPFVCSIMIAATSLLSTGMSTNLNAIKNTYGLSGTASSMIMTVRSISAFLVMFVSDRYFEKLGVRKGTALAMILGVFAFLVFAFGNGKIAAYYFAAAIGGITYAYGLMLPASMLLKKWFNKHRGLALSIASAGTGLCSIIGAPLLQTIIDHHGLKTAFLYQGAFLLAVSLLLFTVLIDDPAKVGLEPVGGKDYVTEKKKTGHRVNAELPGFWIAMLFFATVLVGLNSSPASSHLTLNFTTAGFDAMSVAKALSVYGFMLIIAKLVYGQVLDKLGAVKTVWIFGTVLILGKVLCWFAYYVSGISYVFIAMLIYGMGVPIETLGYPNWCADLTTAEKYPKVLSKLQMGYQLGALLGSSLPGVFCDLTGSYGWFYLIGAVLMGVTFIIVLIAYRKFSGASEKTV